MFGFEDRLLHPIANGTDILSANNWKQKSLPVHVIDVGRALEIIAYDDHTAGQTFELYGPREYSKEQIAHLVYRMILKERKHVNLPKPLLKTMTKILNMVWWPTYSTDEIEREFIDQKIDPTAKTFKDLGITPGELDDIALQYIRDYRLVLRLCLSSSTNHACSSAAYYDLPPMTAKEKREERKYLHTVDDM